MTPDYTPAQLRELERDAKFGREVVAALNASKGDPILMVELIGDCLERVLVSTTLAEIAGDVT